MHSVEMRLRASEAVRMKLDDVDLYRDDIAISGSGLSSFLDLKTSTVYFPPLRYPHHKIYSVYFEGVISSILVRVA